MGTLVPQLGPLAAAGAQPAQDDPPITVTELFGPAGERIIEARQINERGQVLGWVLRPPIGWFQPIAGVVWEDGVATEITAPTNGPPLMEGQLMTTGVEISELGLVAGTRLHVSGFLQWPFSWRNGQYTALEPEVFTPQSNSNATDVNEWGQILGWKATAAMGPPGPTFDAHAVVWRNGQVVATSDLQASPVDINNTGTAVVDVLHNGPFERTAGVWRLGRGVTDLGTLGGPTSRGVAINEIGQVVGVSTTAPGSEEHVFLWHRGTMTDLGTLGGARSSVGPTAGGLPIFATDQVINEWGQVVGGSQTAEGTEHAFLWHRGRMTDLGTLGGNNSTAVAINDWGQVVGQAQTADGDWHAFVWEDGEMTDLGALVAGARNSRVLDINNHGQIVGTAGAGAVIWDTRP